MFKSYEEVMQKVFPSMWKDAQVKKERQRIKNMSPQEFAKFVINNAFNV